MALLFNRCGKQLIYFEMVPKPHTLVLSHNCFAASFQQVPERDLSADAPALAIRHRENCQTLRSHHLRRAADSRPDRVRAPAICTLDVD